jgi:hypothetical protein
LSLSHAITDVGTVTYDAGGRQIGNDCRFELLRNCHEISSGAFRHPELAVDPRQEVAVAEACPPVLAGGLFTSSAGHGHARYYSKTIRGNGDVTGKLTVWKRAG